MIDAGYKVVGAYGDTCSVTNDLFFTQTVTFEKIKYKMVARLETTAIDTREFLVCVKSSDSTEIEIDTALGAAFFVPKEVYASDYITNYFCGAFDSSRLKSY